MSKSRAIGTQAETAVVRYLRDNGFPHAERRALGGNSDRGDIAGVVSTVIEVKNCARMELGEWVKEANREAGNDGVTYGVVWHKRRGYSNPAGWFVTMDGWTFVQLLRAALGVDRPAISAVGRAPLDEMLAARLAANEATVLDEIAEATEQTNVIGEPTGQALIARGTAGWVWRCEGWQNCDGHLATGYPSPKSAEQAARQHLRTKHEYLTDAQQEAQR